MQNRISRFSKIETFNLDPIKANADSIGYSGSGKTMKISLFNHLGSMFPDVEGIEVQVKDGLKAPDRMPFSGAGRQMREIDGKIYCVFVVLTGADLFPNLPDEIPTGSDFVGVVTDKTGKVLKTITSDFGGHIEDAIIYTFDRWHYDAAARKLTEKSNVTTTVHPINEVSYQHLWNASITAPGIGTFETGGAVKELRDKGANHKAANFAYFTEAHVWPFGDYATILAKDFSGAWHYATFQGGKELNRSHSGTFKSAVVGAGNIHRHFASLENSK